VTEPTNLLPEGLREAAARRDAALGTLDAESLTSIESASTLLVHVDDGERARPVFGIARIERNRAVLSAYSDPPDARGEAEVIEALAVAIKARRLLESGWLRIERVLRTETVSLQQDFVAEYQRLGFEYFYTEHEMERDLSVLPDVSPPAGAVLVPWTREHDAEIRVAYNDAFRDRGFAGFDEADWAGETFSAQDGFRADLSFLAFAGGVLAGFCLCEESDGADTGWIDTVGVRPPHRGRGIASAMVVRSMQAMQAAGLVYAALRVNDDNARARRLYERLNFRISKKHVVYRKEIG
jgi:ribosomal protein S18 acetylase RimI-like enzyme